MLIYYAQYNQMTDKDFCKDNRLVLIVECLFAKARAANAEAWALATRPTVCSLCCPQEDVSAASDPIPH